MQGAALVKTVT